MFLKDLNFIGGVLSDEELWLDDIEFDEFGDAIKEPTVEFVGVGSIILFEKIPKGIYCVFSSLPC